MVAGGDGFGKNDWIDAGSGLDRPEMMNGKKVKKKKKKKRKGKFLGNIWGGKCERFVSMG